MIKTKTETRTPKQMDLEDFYKLTKTSDDSAGSIPEIDISDQQKIRTAISIAGKSDSANSFKEKLSKDLIDFIEKSNSGLKDKVLLVKSVMQRHP